LNRRVGHEKKYEDVDAAEEQQKLWNNGAATFKTSLAYVQWLKTRRDRLNKHVAFYHKFIRF
jgi:hypothetical protein